MFFKKKTKPKFTELFTRVRHKEYGEGFIFAYSDNYPDNIGVKFVGEKYNGDLGSLIQHYIKRGYPTLGNSEWFSEDQLEEVKDFDYESILRQNSYL